MANISDKHTLSPEPVYSLELTIAEARALLSALTIHRISIIAQEREKDLLRPLAAKVVEACGEALMLKTTKEKQ